MSHFVDTNIVVYAFQRELKSERALLVLADATISVQVLNEFTNVCLRKLSHDHHAIDHFIEQIRSTVAGIEPLVEETHDTARAIAARYRLGFYDSVLLASALLAECEIFYSEDLQDGLVVEGSLTIRNPFA